MNDDPVTFDGTVSKYSFNEDRTQLYVTTRTTDANGSSTYAFHIVPVDGSVAAL